MVEVMATVLVFLAADCLLPMAIIKATIGGHLLLCRTARMAVDLIIVAQILTLLRTEMCRHTNTIIVPHHTTTLTRAALLSNSHYLHALRLQTPSLIGTVYPRCLLIVIVDVDLSHHDLGHRRQSPVVASKPAVIATPIFPPIPTRILARIEGGTTVRLIGTLLLITASPFDMTIRVPATAPIEKEREIEDREAGARQETGTENEKTGIVNWIATGIIEIGRGIETEEGMVVDLIRTVARIDEVRDRVHDHLLLEATRVMASDMKIPGALNNRTVGTVSISIWTISEERCLASDWGTDKREQKSCICIAGGAPLPVLISITIFFAFRAWRMGFRTGFWEYGDLFPTGIDGRMAGTNHSQSRALRADYSF